MKAEGVSAIAMFVIAMFVIVHASSHMFDISKLFQ